MKIVTRLAAVALLGGLLFFTNACCFFGCGSESPPDREEAQEPVVEAVAE